MQILIDKTVFKCYNKATMKGRCEKNGTNKHL